MKMLPQFRYLIFGLIALVIISSVTAVAAANTIPSTRAADRINLADINDLKPSSCSTLNLTEIIICSSAGGACNGTKASELILGSPLVDNIQGDKGNDCILGGGGDDLIRGDQGSDVCIGGPGSDTFHASCETEIQ